VILVYEQEKEKAEKIVRTRLESGGYEVKRFDKYENTRKGIKYSFSTSQVPSPLSISFSWALLSLAQSLSFNCGTLPRLGRVPDR
jgi:hypothetical protein